MTPEADSMQPPVKAPPPLVLRMRAKGWIVMWVVLGSLFGLAPITIYVGRPGWLLWCIIGTLGVTLYQVFRLPEPVNTQWRLKEELVAGVATVFPLTILGLIWLLYYGGLYWAIYVVLRLYGPAAEIDSFRYASWISLLAPVLFGAGFISLATSKMANQIYGLPASGPEVSFRQSVHRHGLLVALAVAIVVVGIGVVSYYALFAHSLWSLAAIQAVIIGVSSYLWNLGKEGPPAVFRREAMRVLEKLLEALEYKLVSIASPQEFESLGFDLIGVRGHAAAALLLITPDSARTPDTLTFIKSATRLREDSWSFLRRSFSKEVSSLEVVLAFAGLEPPPAFVKFARDEFIRCVALSHSEVARILEEDEVDRLRKSARELLSFEPGKAAWL